MGFEQEMMEHFPYPAVLLDSSFHIQHPNGLFKERFDVQTGNQDFFILCLLGRNAMDDRKQAESHFLKKGTEPFLIPSDHSLQQPSCRPIQWTLHQFKAPHSSARYSAFATPVLNNPVQESYFQTTMDSIGDGLISTDSEGRILYMNPIAEKLCGWKLTDARNKDVSVVFNIVNSKTRRPAEDIVRKVLRTGLTSGLANDTLLISSNGSECQIADTAAPITNGSEIAGVVLVFRDVTSEYQAAKRIKESEERFRSIIHSMPMGVHLYKLEEDGRLIFTGANPSADKMLGVENSLFIGKTIEEAFPPLADTPIPEKYRTVARTGEPWNTEQVDYHDNKIRGAYQVSAFRFMPMSVTVMFLDISERKRAEEEIRASETRFKQISENIQDGIIIIEEEKFVYRNKRATEIFGDCPYGGDDCLKRFLSFFNESDVKRVENHLSNPDGKVMHFSEPGFWINRPDGTRRYIMLRSTHASQSPRSLYLFITDMTDWANLMEERNRLYNYSIDMLCVAGFDGFFKQLNPAWTRSLGWSTSEILSKPWLYFVHPDDRERTKAATAQLEKGQPVILFENRYLCKDGGYKWLSWNSFPLQDEKSIFSVVRDVTQQKQLEEDIRQAEKMESIGKLAGGIAHDFNNHLAAIIGCVDILNSMIRDDPALGQTREFVEMIGNSAQRSAQLTGQLLAFARKGKYQSTTIDIHALINETISILRRTIDKKISIEQKMEAHDHFISGDPTQIQNALLNISLNARDAMPQGGKLTLSTRNEERILNVSISDTGIGMDRETLKHAFEPFFTTKPKGQGTGLGLSAVDGIMRTHNGTIQIESTPGAGTTMTLRFLTVPAPIESGGDPPFPNQGEGSLGHVLIIDDEPLICKVAGKILESCGYTVTMFNDSRKAVSSLPHLEPMPQVVILDMIMPGMNGTEVFRKIRSLDPKMKIIISSGYTLNDEAQTLLNEGAVAFLQKPFLKTQLQDAVAKALKGT
jgi:PAS domain S-box-containing protein